MLLHILRAIFVLAVAAVAMSFAENYYIQIPAPSVLLGALGIATLVIALDVFIPQKSLGAISGLFFGLIVGLLVAYGLCLILDLMVRAYQPELPYPYGKLLSAVKVLVGIVCCYLAVSFILQTKDDVRFVIPYVEFSKQSKGAHPLVLDTSVIIDGRIVDICETRIIDSALIVPRFVLSELQAIGDSGDKLKRNRGRRGLDVLNKLQALDTVDVKIVEGRVPRSEAGESVDHRLVSVAHEMGGRIVTNDYNLNKISQVRGVEVININDLANALKPVFLPGENVTVKIVKPGEEAGQGVGYLDDGTMVVVEGARDRIGEVVPLTVTSVLQTTAGRMVFGRTEHAHPAERRRRSRTATS